VRTYIESEFLPDPRHITAMSSSALPRRWRCAAGKKKFDIATQMIKARERRVDTILGFRENERALTDALHMKREAPGGPFGLTSVQTHRSRNVRLKRLDVAEDR